MVTISVDRTGPAWDLVSRLTYEEPLVIFVPIYVLLGFCW